MRVVRVANSGYLLDLRIRATAWEILTRFWLLFTIARDVYRNRKALSKIARSLPRLALAVSVKTFGICLAMFGALLLASLPISTFMYVHASNSAGLFSSSQAIPFSVGTGLGILILAIWGLIMLGIGLWLVAPNSRPGRFGFRLVVEHMFRRGKRIQFRRNTPAPVSCGL